MQLVLITALLGLVANAAPVEDSSLHKRDTLSHLDFFGSSGCNSYQGTITTSSSGRAFNGGCGRFGRAVPSIRATYLLGGCTVTVYTDENCSNGATAARVGSCLSGWWQSFSTDTC